MFRWSGGLVVRAVKVFMVAKVVQVVPMVQVIRLGRVAHVVRWSFGHLVRWSGWLAWLICFQKIYGLSSKS